MRRVRRCGFKEVTAWKCLAALKRLKTGVEMFHKNVTLNDFFQPF